LVETGFEPMTLTNLAPYWENIALGLYDTSGNILKQIEAINISFRLFFVFHLFTQVPLAYALLEAQTNRSETK